MASSYSPVFPRVPVHRKCRVNVDLYIIKCNWQLFGGHELERKISGVTTFQVVP